MRTLVTGGLGFVGSNLVDMLVDMGDIVTVIDDLSSESASLDYRNPAVEYHYANIKHTNTVFAGYKFDRIFHLAAKARIQPSFEIPLNYFESNATGTMILLEFARLSGCKSFVYATTSSKNHGTSRLTPYTFSKVVGEEAVRMYAEIYGMNTAMATFYNVYGPREPRKGEWATVVAKFLRQSYENEPITVVGNGQQTRDFTHVEDICNGLIAISDGEWKGENFDLGRGEPISILKVAEAVCEGETDNIVFVPLRKNEGMHTLSNWQETEAKLGWRATKNLLDYIAEKNKDSHEVQFIRNFASDMGSGG